MLSTDSTALCDAPRLNVALARLVDLKAALLAEAKAHTGSLIDTTQGPIPNRQELRGFDAWQVHLLAPPRLTCARYVIGLGLAGVVAHAEFVSRLVVGGF